MTQILLGLLLLTAPFGRPAAAQDFFCESVFASANAHTADFFQESLDGIEDGLIPWDSTDWEQLVRQEVMAGEAKELTVLSWDGRIPNVELRVWFDDWCSPGQPLEWIINADASVDVPSNGGEEGSPLHCGRTPEARFEWVNGAYTQVG